MKNGKKMGRPTENPKTNIFRMRIADDDLEKLQECSEKMGVSRADVVRIGLHKVYNEICISE